MFRREAGYRFAGVAAVGWGIPDGAGGGVRRGMCSSSPKSACQRRMCPGYGLVSSIAGEGTFRSFIGGDQRRRVDSTPSALAPCADRRYGFA